MNIRPVNTQAVQQQPQPITPRVPERVQTESAGDSFNPAQNEKLVNMLQEQPDVRPEAVQRAQNLASDPNYPGEATITNLAKLFISDSTGD